MLAVGGEDAGHDDEAVAGEEKAVEELRVLRVPPQGESDRARCTVSMRQFPYSGATFYDTVISEAGRQLIARELTALSERQLTSLFAGA